MRFVFPFLRNLTYVLCQEHEYELLSHYGSDDIDHIDNNQNIVKNIKRCLKLVIHVIIRDLQRIFTIISNK